MRDGGLGGQVLLGQACPGPVEAQRWSAFWDKRFGVWRVAEDDPDSDLYAESNDADTVLAYITAHS